MANLKAVTNCDWSFLSTFSSERLDIGSEADWSTTAAWATTALSAVDQLRADLVGAVGVWNERLAHLGGDPCTHDWRAFRPLRLSREEDWSDWLAHLLQTSQSGAFALLLFGDGVAKTVALPEVVREENTVDLTRRLDLLVKWSSREMTHVEVKLWDENFAKTFEASLMARADNPTATGWSNFIVLPDESVEEWLVVADQQQRPSGAVVNHVTWTRVAEALRTCLLSDHEAIAWRVWAYSLCGAIEQQLLGHLPFPVGGAHFDLADAGAMKRQTDMLMRALRNDRQA